MNTRVSARARDDLAGIVAYICSRQGEKAGDRFVALAEQAVSFLSKNPQAGPHPRWRTRHKTLRFWVISRTNHLIYYFADESGVSIERVLDGRRDVMRVVERGLEEPEEEN